MANRGRERLGSLASGFLSVERSERTLGHAQGRDALVRLAYEPGGADSGHDDYVLIRTSKRTLGDTVAKALPGTDSCVSLVSSR
jgi:hypothetical protein